ncbi:hypothetical protein HMPREF9418_1543, partial [Neisseria macacae ATCC 33926]
MRKHRRLSGYQSGLTCETQQKGRLKTGKPIFRRPFMQFCFRRVV